MSNGLTLPFQAKLSTTGNVFAITVTDGGGGAISGSSFGTAGVAGETDVGVGVNGSAVLKTTASDVLLIGSHETPDILRHLKGASSRRV